jgi:hypothetical protein
VSGRPETVSECDAPTGQALRVVIEENLGHGDAL